jgi:hypothetical protein
MAFVFSMKEIENYITEVLHVPPLSPNKSLSVYMTEV